MAFYICSLSNKKKCPFTTQIIKKSSATIYLISISLPRISSTPFPIAVICSSFLPTKLQPNHRSAFNDDNNMWKNAGSMRTFFDRSSTDIPSIFTWLNGLLRNAFDIAFIVFDASSKWSIQLQIFNVFSIL